MTAGFLNHQQYGKNTLSSLEDEFEKIYPSIKVYPPEVSQFAPEKWPKPNRKGSSSNHPFFRGELLNFRGVPVFWKPPTAVVSVFREFRQYTSVPGCYDVSAWIFEVRFVPKEQRITGTVEVSSDQLTLVNCCIEGIKNYPVIWGL